MTPAAPPLVTVVTPTWQRHDPLLKRCIPSVQAQTWPVIEHIIVSDGPDPDLAAILAGMPGITYAELPEHEPSMHWGSPARQLGTKIAAGALIAYNDDDDALRPDHVRLLAEALIADPGVMWACSRMVSHQVSGESVIGHGQLGFGNVGTPMLMHRPELLELAGWDVSSPGEDWEIVSRWLGAGARYVRVDAETVDVWPSTFWNGRL